MNSRRRMILIAGALLVLGTGGAYHWWTGARREARLVEYRRQLQAAPARTRLAAADGILAIRGLDPDASLARARALIELHRPAKAREGLELLANSDLPGRYDALCLRGESFLAEAEDLVAEATPINADVIGGRMEGLLQEADGIRKVLAGRPEFRVRSRLLEARELNVRAGLLAARWRGVNAELARARTAGLTDQLESLGPLAQQMQAEIADLDARLAAVCHEAPVVRDAGSEPFELLFQMRMRGGDVAAARVIADELARQDRVDAAVAARVADALLRLDWTIGQASGPQDQSLAERLLEHREVQGHRGLEFRLAQTELALRRANWAAAESQARQVLADYDALPRAMCQLAQALAGQGRAEDAIRLLQPLDERVESSAVRYALGQAYGAAGREDQARETLKQAVELQPNLLPPRLALVESLVAAGLAGEAESDIVAAVSLSPSHPRATAVHFALMVAKEDLRRIVERVDGALRGADRQPQWEHAALGAAMALDDPGAVGLLAAALRERAPADVVAALAEAWRRAPPARRFAAGGAICDAVLEAVDADPLQHARPARPRHSLQNTPLTGNRFLDRPVESAEELTSVALDRWPDQPWLLELGVMAALMRDDAAMLERRLARYRRLVPTPPLADALTAFQEGNHAAAGQRLAAAATRPAGEGALRAWLEYRVALALSTPPGRAALLQAFLKQHGWCEPAVILMLQQYLAEGDQIGARGLLQAINRANSRLALLTGARLSLALGDSRDAFQRITMLLTGDAGTSELRCQGVEVQATIALVEKRADLGGAGFESLAISAPYRRIAMQTAAIDLVTVANQERSVGATAALVGLLSDNRTPPRWLDRLLARAHTVLPPQRYAAVLDGLLQYRPGEPILLVWKAQQLAEEGDLAAAADRLGRLDDSHARSPRVLYAQAQLALSQGRPDLAVRTLGELRKAGGSAAEAADEALSRLPPVSTHPGENVDR